MLFKQGERPGHKPVDVLINSKSHVQKKYFSLMLVPSYSSGKTRSIRIPYRTFHILGITLLTISAVVLAFYLRANYFRLVAQDYSSSLDQVQEAYLELQESSVNEQNKLLDSSQKLQTQLSEAESRIQAEKDRQRQAYEASLEELREQADEVERQLNELDEARQDILSQLGAKAYIPPVRTLVNELMASQTETLSSLGDGHVLADEGETSATSQGLQEYLGTLTTSLQTQLSCYADMKEKINKMSPYLKNYPTRWPVSGPVTSSYGYRQNPMGGTGGESHTGLDIQCSTGTSVYATGGGTVNTSGWMNGYGNIVIIDHGFGIQTVYGHNSKLLVREGQRVERGDIIALSGSTGRSTGPHVHYEVRVNGAPTNPNQYLLER